MLNKYKNRALNEYKNKSSKKEKEEKFLKKKVFEKKKYNTKMKKIILILLLLFSVNVYSQIDTSIWSLTRNSSDGKYSLITNKLSFGGVGAGTITVPLTLTIADIDTSKYSLLRNNIDGKYSTAINKTSLYGIDSGMIKVSVSYNLNPPTAQSLGIDSLIYKNLLDPIDFTNGKIIIGEDSAFVPKTISEALYAKQVGKMTIDSLFTNILYINGSSDTRPYYVYAAFFSQFDTNALSVTILENTIGNIIWIRNNAGEYVGTLANAFTVNKVCSPQDQTICTTEGRDNEYGLYIYSENINTIQITTLDSSFNRVDSFLDTKYIEIRVYK